jgi:hypothetical protein
MKKLLWLWCAFAGVLSMISCIATTKTREPVQDEVETGYPSRWEEATLIQDEFGFELIVVRQNDERWKLQSKTTCFWARQLVGKTVWLKWGPVESLLMNDRGEICEFWTGERIE